MVNWKQRNKRKRQKVGDEDVVEANSSAVRSGDTSIDIPNTSSPEDGGPAATVSRPVQDEGAAQMLDLASLQGLDLKSLQTAASQSTTGRYECPGCKKSVSMFCPSCLTLDECLWQKKRKEQEEERINILKEGQEEDVEMPVFPVLHTKDFPLKLHVIMHPKEKLQRSSCAGLKFLCRDYYDWHWITRRKILNVEVGHDSSSSSALHGAQDLIRQDKDSASISKTNGLGLHPLNKNSSDKKAWTVDSLPWITTSNFMKVDVPGPEQAAEIVEAAAEFEGPGLTKGFPPSKTNNKATAPPKNGAKKNPPSAFVEPSSPSMFSCTKEFFATVDPAECVLVYPSDDALSVHELASQIVQHDSSSRSASPSEKTIKMAILVDCTWFQTEEVFKRLPVLNTLQKVRISRHKTLFWRHHGRQQSGGQGLSDEHLSTVEAGYWLLRELLESCAAVRGSSFRNPLSSTPSGTSAAMLTEKKKDTVSREKEEKETVLEKNTASLINSIEGRRDEGRTNDDVVFDTEENEYRGEFDAMLLWFAHQWTKIQNVYQSKGQKMIHNPSWVSPKDKI